MLLLLAFYLSIICTLYWCCNAD